ncbi:DHH family phosphoesterase [Edaphobacillus lindanitolerans]|uniref:Phosphoesterase RecJ domain-containing protein n=1 Tax=Edaphobacillus lindanitolerans TaxID=550447 RepID=A0A1U7PQD9_9BACI|nr:bifunctional oligoribonuclease/PAP phosphatase NrnA [Edaphobacillus lindanitolerans]SIT85069.1 phosphoesterase RecJ domain-containing protein [Edaphobacillus lindanitolerans]
MKRQIIDMIEQYETIIIHRHVRPDPDAYGSQLGLKEIIRSNYPGKSVFAAGTPDPSLDYLGGPDELPAGIYDGALVIVTDTANTERIDGDRYAEGAALLKIDHHPDDDRYGDLRWVISGKSSTSEMIYDLFREGAESRGWRMDAAAARLLFAGIVGDTGRFVYPATTADTFRAAADLITRDFDRTVLYDAMFEMDAPLLKLNGYIYQNLDIDENGAAVVTITADIMERFGLTPQDTAKLVSAPGIVKGIRAWLFKVEEPDQIRLRFRSKGPVVNTLAKQFGGGGHAMAAGASAKDWEEAERAARALRDLCRR